MHNIARINSGGVNVSRFTPSIACASRDRRMDLSVREKMPPPFEISLRL